MGRKKLEKFADNKLAKNVFEPGKEGYEQIKGEWKSKYFKNKNPLVVELGCGRGEYTIGLAREEEDKNFIGVDIKGNRIWSGSQDALLEGLGNVAFLRTEILLIEKFFDEGEVDEIWITFPDPRPKDRDEKRRLTSPRFLELYRKILKKGGKIHFKTDNKPLFDYTLDVIEDQKLPLEHSTFDLYDSDLIGIHKSIQTRYEMKYLAQGIKINYMSFYLN